ncbi:hypothetical protein AKJ55_01000 [candidate division MSBL1 archaeon SCGC-AAA382M17]|uniref:Polysaccharide biosynthesis protein C-terminal domain-containing protein n=1 Tax=candidate division MSBL1 archaeon SCGC-AAA382M17 TaxID=1698284 RepID=A0ABR5TJK8_9EURY|nr:hypothetical protein AKJ55_01000 [candidate division MSBL1 archaeon SCGC-AAA382M17]
MLKMEDDQRSSENSFFHGVSITFLGLVILAISNFVLRVFLAQGLSKEEFGLFFSIFNFLGLLTILSHLGLNQSITKFVSKFRSENNPIKIKKSIISSLPIITLLSVSIVIILIVFSDFLASAYFGTSQAVSILIILSFWFLFMAYHNFLTSVLQGFENFLGRTSGRIIRAILPLSGIIFFSYLFDLEITSAAFFYLIGPIFSVIFLYLFLRRKNVDLLAKPFGKISIPMIKKMMWFGAPLILTGISVSIVRRTDTLMLTALRPLADVGTYQVSRVVVPLLRYFGIAIGVPLFPLVSRLWESNERDSVGSILSFILKYSFILAIPLAIIVISFPDIFIRLFFGNEYLSAVTPMRILSMAVIFSILGSITSSTLKGIDESTLVMRSSIAPAVFNIPANLILIPIYGVTGAALATGLSFLVGSSVGLYYSRKKIDFSFPFRSLTLASSGGFIVFLFVYLLRIIITLSIWPKFFVITISGLFLYVVWLLLTKTVTKEDLTLLKKSTSLPEKIFDVLNRFTME